MPQARYPAVLPPFFTSEGEMLVDGALMDNVPIAPMRALKTGPNVVVVLGVDSLTKVRRGLRVDPGPGSCWRWRCSIRLPGSGFRRCRASCR